MTRHDRPEGRPAGVGTPGQVTAAHRRERLDWPAIVPAAAAIVASYDTSVTLRQLFYRLVSAEVLPNTQTAYKSLSSKTAEARREGRFPALVDRVRGIDRRSSWTGPSAALAALARQYRRDRTEGQEVGVYMAVEKAGLLAQLDAWYSPLGLPLLALGGYCSQSLADEVADDVEAQGRPAVLLYAGDHDASGEDIDRDFVARTGCWDKVVRVALSAEQVVEHDLPPLPGKVADSRAGAFARRHGGLVQVELDALPPEVLHELYDDALSEWWDPDAHSQVLAVEREERQHLLLLADREVTS